MIISDLGPSSPSVTTDVFLGFTLCLWL